MALKYTLVINWGGTRGWTETFYYPLDESISSPAAIARGRDLARQRANCLTANATVTAVKISNPTGNNQVQGVSTNFRGSLSGFDAAVNADAPILAVLVNFYAVNGSRRSFLQRGLVDGDVVGGIVTYAVNGSAPFTTFWQWIITAGLAIQDILNGPTVPITSIDGNGLVLVTGAVPGGDTLVLIKTRHAGNGPKIRALLQASVDGLPEGQMQLRNWKKGNATGGTYNIATKAYASITSFQSEAYQQVRSHKTGRNFGQSRGRQSARN